MVKCRNRNGIHRTTEAGFFRSSSAGILSICLLFGAVGCGEGQDSARESSYSDSAWESSEPPEIPETEEEPVVPDDPNVPDEPDVPDVPDEPEPPEGTVPAAVVGAWRGGPGDKTGYNLTITSDGLYELSHDNLGAIPEFVERGYTAGDATTLLLRPVTVEGPVVRQERTIQWSVQSSSVGDGLMTWDPIDGEFSYVRIG